MTLSLAKTKILPPKITIYADGGIGKTTFGTQAESPVFVPTENGLVAFPHIPQYPQSKTFEEFMGYITELASVPHQYKTLVVDSVDWLEPLILDKVCRESNVKNIEDANGGFGKWTVAALDIWREYYSALDYLNQQKSMTIIQIAHAQIKRYDNPETQGYDRINIKLQDGKSTSAAALLFEWSDIVLYANYYVGITKEVLPGSTKKNVKERARAVGSGERVLHTTERPAFKAKNRFGMPEQITFDAAGEYWNVIKSYVPFYNQKGE